MKTTLLTFLASTMAALAVNQTPTIDEVPDQNVLPQHSIGIALNGVIDPDGDAIFMFAVSDNTNVVEILELEPVPSNGTNYLIVRPKQFGQAIIYVHLYDGHPSENGWGRTQFTVNVGKIATLKVQQSQKVSGSYTTVTNFPVAIFPNQTNMYYRLEITQ